MIGRSKTPKGLMDAADLRRLVLRFPERKAEQGPVVDALRRLDASPHAFQAWQTLVAEEILPEDEDTGF